ncbi:hypothetical protein [Amycolatopsis sp. NPDC003861]
MVGGAEVVGAGILLDDGGALVVAVGAAGEAGEATVEVGGAGAAEATGCTSPATRMKTANKPAREAKDGCTADLLAKRRTTATPNVVHVNTRVTQSRFIQQILDRQAFSTMQHFSIRLEIENL